MSREPQPTQTTLSTSRAQTSAENFTKARAFQLAVDLASLVQINTVSRSNLMLDFLIQNYRSAEKHAKQLKADMRDEELEALNNINAYIEIIPNDNQSEKLSSYNNMMASIAKVAHF